MAGHMYNGRETELLIPASSLEVLKIAVIFGADAVYIGGEAFGLRAKAKNFSKEDMIEGIKFAHERDVKVYVTANILAHNYDLDGAREYFKELDVIKPDAVIISAGISSFFIVGFSCRNFLISSLILFSNLGLLDAKFSLPDDGIICLLPSFCVNVL